MNSEGKLLKDARERASLSTRELAAASGISASTISRIELGKQEPTLGTLLHLMRSAGEDAEVFVRTRNGPEIASLSDALRHTGRGDQIDWTQLRAFLDYLTLHPELRISAIRARPRRSRSQLLDNLLAAIAEKISDDAGAPRPAWARHIHALSEPWTTPGTPRIQEEARKATPRQFAERNITLAETSLWRATASKDTEQAVA
jgi:transcriptional regulator with XRE-family HTH domain